MPTLIQDAVALLLATIFGTDEDVITFDDLPDGTRVTDQYRDRFGIVFGPTVQAGNPAGGGALTVQAFGPTHSGRNRAFCQQAGTDPGFWGHCVPARQHLGVYVGAFDVSVHDQRVTLEVFDGRLNQLASTSVITKTAPETEPLVPLFVWRPSADISYFHIYAGAGVYVDDVACDPRSLPWWIAPKALYKGQP